MHIHDMILSRRHLNLKSLPSTRNYLQMCNPHKSVVVVEGSIQSTKQQDM